MKKGKEEKERKDSLKKKRGKEKEYAAWETRQWGHKSRPKKKSRLESKKTKILHDLAETDKKVNFRAIKHIKHIKWSNISGD